MTKVVVESKKWFAEAKELVRNYDFSLVHVEYNPKEEHCEFCGTAILYIAVIDGKPMFAGTSHPVRRRIGCDCLERVLGNTWRDFQKMSAQLKTLKDIVATEKRKVKYAETYKKEIEYLKDLDTNTRGAGWNKLFLIDMKHILETGDRVMTKNMDIYLRKLVAQDALQKIKKMEVKQVEEFKVQDWSNRIIRLLGMIEQVMGAKIHETAKNDYTITNSILNFLNTKKMLTVKQMELLNDKYEYYSKRIQA